MIFQLQDISAQLAALKCTGQVSFSSISTDTRKLMSGDLFIALQGPNFDGNDYVEQAKEKGAVAVLVSRESDIGLPQLVVADTRLAMAALAKLRRQQMAGTWIAVTGSNGKTTVKEMLGKMLAQAGQVDMTQGNLNNDIGVPLTIWNMEPEHSDFHVLELGASAQGEIAYTCAISLPDIAILTNAQEAHLPGFGSYQGVIDAKGEIVSSLGPDGQAVLNMDDPSFEYWHKLADGRRVWSFSVTNTEARVYAKNLSVAENSSQFDLHIDQQKGRVYLPLAGGHNVANALATSAAAAAVGLSIDQICYGLSLCKPYQGRLVRHVRNNNVVVIDDTYNANPSSVKAAIDVLVQQTGTLCLMLGDMRELGETSVQLHQQVGQYAAQKDIDILLGMGPLANHAVQAFSAKGGRQGVAAKDFAEVLSLLPTLPKENVCFLVKGSRASRMERIVDQLL